MLGLAALAWSSAASAQTAAPELTQAQPAPAPLAAAPLAQPAPVFEMQTRPNRSMLMIGLLTFGQAYIASMGIAATSSTRGDDNLWIPVLGPWLDLGARPGCPSSTNCGTQNGYKVLLAANGLLQSFGAFQLVGAFLWPEVVSVTRVGKASGPSVSLQPAPVGGGAYGLAATGRF